MVNEANRSTSDLLTRRLRIANWQAWSLAIALTGCPPLTLLAGWLAPQPHKVVVAYAVMAAIYSVGIGIAAAAEVCLVYVWPWPPPSPTDAGGHGETVKGTGL